jgi:hypothetical protein
MKMDIHIPGADRIESLRLYIRHQVDTELGRHAERLSGVTVLLSEYWGPEKGVVVTKCRIEADLGTLGSKLAREAMDSNPYRAVDRATEAIRLSLNHGAQSPEPTGSGEVASLGRMNEELSARGVTWQPA